MRFPVLFAALAVAVLLCTGHQSFAGEKDDLAALKAQVADLQARVTHAETWAAKTAGFRPLPPKTINLKAEAQAQRERPITVGFEAPKGTAPAKVTGDVFEANKRGKIIAERHNSNGTIDRWEEDKPAWLDSGGSCPSGSCGNVTAQRMPARIQAPSCPNGKCPNQ